MTPTDSELRSIRKRIDLVGRLSDNLVRLGPFSLGIDGVLSWIPAVGEIYSLGAGAYLLAQGAKARVPASVLARCALILGVRTLGDVVPFAGPVFADVFTAHKWAARLLGEAIDKKLGVVIATPAGGRRNWGAKFATAP